VVSSRGDSEAQDLQTFVVRLGAAISATGEAAYTVQRRLETVSRAYGMGDARISAFPTFMMVTLGRGQPATLEIASSPSVPRLDQIAALDLLVREAERGSVPPADGLRRLDEIDSLPNRFGSAQRLAGYAVLTLGLCLILKPSPREVAAAAVFGVVVGLLRSIGPENGALQTLMPVLAAFTVAVLTGVAVRNDLAGPGLRAMVASLIVFLPGVSLTTAVLELASGQVMSGASRLVAGFMQLAFLAFGLVAGIEAAGVEAADAFVGASGLLGPWAPWLGVLVFAVGVTVANSAPARSFPGLLLVLYAAWIGQIAGNALLGGRMSAFVGALVMTPVAVWVTRLPSAMPPQASFLPGFWLLVPGALGLIGLAQIAGDAGSGGVEELVNTVVSMFAISMGVLCGTLVLGWAATTGRFVDGVSASVLERLPGRTRHR
jgi:uncharacterized membrane protein YjjP (DUF1212 family)